LGPREKEVTKVGYTLNNQQKQHLTELLVSHRGNFAFRSKDVPGISSKIASHRLSVNPSFPLVCQKKKSVRGDRQKAIAEEVDKLMSAGFIWEVTYPEWLANVMMVKKANDKWKMCIAILWASFI
jgi:hypothetical protein